MFRCTRDHQKEKMYVTRPLSLYRNSPIALSMEPPEGPYTGYLVITDEEAEAQDTFCWGACKTRRIKKLPFPQDRILNVVHSSDYEETSRKKVWFLPVLDLPLSSNYYYVIKAKGRHKGRAYTSSRDMDMGGSCCFENSIKDIKPKPLDCRNVYQKFKISRHHGTTFFANSIAPDGFPPKFLRRKRWEVRASRFYKSHLTDALGLDSTLRTRLPSFNFPILRNKSPSVIVGKWYCPFVFVRESKARLSQQMRKSIFYTMTLEQHWQSIYFYENVNQQGIVNFVTVDTPVQREVDYVFGMEAVKGDRVIHGGFVLYRVRSRNRGRSSGFSVGLSVATVEKMKWVEEEGGWLDGGDQKVVRVERTVEIRASESGWRRFGCYMLVESFVLRRMDGSLVMKCEFRHTDKIKCKCE